MTLSKIFPFLFLFIFISSINSQSKSEIGIILGSISPAFENIEKAYDMSFINGFILKQYDGKNIFRFSGRYKKSKPFDSFSKNAIGIYFHGKTNHSTLRFGTERQFRLGRLYPYIATDLVIKRIVVSGIEYGCFSRKDIEISQNALGISPLLGFNFKITKRFSIAFESSLDIIHYVQFKSIPYSDILLSNKTILNDKLNIFFNPSNLSFNISL